jgi:2,3-bisphosphoglycerate-independent phosphoglycerate mutase
VIRDGQAEGVRTRPPGSFLGERAGDRGPVGPGADLIRSLTERAAEILPKHDINTVRVDLGENPANGIWVWGGGRPAGPPEETAVGSAVGTHPSFLGFAAEQGYRAVGVAPASLPAGNLEEIGRSAVAAVDVSDLVVVHLDGAMEHSLLGETELKVRYLSGADDWVVRPLAERVLAEAEGRILIVASHVASVEKRRVLRDVVPFLVAGGGASHFGEVVFSEEAATAADLVIEDGTGLLGFARRA